MRTDRKSLKWLLQQKFPTPFRQFWLSKLMGFHYDIEYRSGKTNAATDALSRVSGSEILYLAIFLVSSTLPLDNKLYYQKDNNLISIIEELQDLTNFAGFQLKEGLLRKKGKIIVGADAILRHKLINWQHSIP